MWPKPEMSKAKVAEMMNISRGTVYYEPKQPDKDWETKIQIEQVLHEHPSYGHKRIAMDSGINRKRVIRVMKLFGIKPYRRRAKKYEKNKDIKSASAVFDNLLLKQESFPDKPNLIWASDFTYISFQSKFVYLATIMDLFSRNIVGFNILNSHNQELTIGALIHALIRQDRPNILHSDQGVEYTAKDYISLVKQAGINVSMSRKSSPWENGYQESFYSNFKIELGDPNRFNDLGELIWQIYQNIYYYNNLRIHTKLKMPPNEYIERHKNQIY
jgi:putative transposase